jgi:hypothetical protein
MWPKNGIIFSMPLSFPSSPTNGQTYVVGARTWTWNGSIWEFDSSAIGSGSVGESELIAGAVTTAKILDANVTATKLASGAAVSNIGYTPANIASPTFTGTPTLPTGTIATTQTAADSSTKVATTAFVTTADNLKANLAGPTFTGTVVLPSTTSIGTVDSTEIGYLDGVTSALQTQLNAKAPTAGPTFTGTVSASTVNSANYQRNGNIGSIVRYATVPVSFTTTPTAFLINMPGGCNTFNLIACHPVQGVNNTVTVTAIRYGDWSGIQSTTQIQITGSLGNGVHTEPFNVGFYWLAE